MIDYTISDIIDGFLTTLKQSPKLREYVREASFVTVGSLDEDDLIRQAGYGPTVGVAPMQGRFDEDVSGVQNDDGMFVILAMSSNLRSPTSAMHAAAPGEASTLKMVEAIRAWLAKRDNRKLGLDAQAVRLTGWKTIVSKNNASVVGIEACINFRHVKED